MIRASLLTPVVPVALALCSASLHAQRQPRPSIPTFKNVTHVGVGWVANVPNTYLGFSTLGLFPGIVGGAGLYADVKLTTSSPGDEPGYLPNVTPQDAELTYGDLLFDEQSDWLTVDLALVYAVSPELAVYGGAGYARRTHFRQYFDDSETRGEFGFYWVSDADRSGTRVNALGGVMIRLTRFTAFQVGGETQPPGVTLGLTLTFAP